MKEIKDTVRSLVRIAYDGSVHKTFHGTNKEERYATEVRVLKHLEAAGCDFVPRVIEHDDTKLYLVTSNCGQMVERLSKAKQQSLYDELEQYGVRHGDQALRNITYDSRRGRFCVIDFELAEILGESQTPGQPSGDQPAGSPSSEPEPEP